MLRFGNCRPGYADNKSDEQCCNTVMKYACEFEDISSARALIKPLVHKTPLLTSRTLDKTTGRHLLFKAENFQKTGSFKIRGALNAVTRAKHRDASLKNIVTVSCGNHGQAIASAASEVGLSCFVFMPERAPQSIINAVSSYGAKVILEPCGSIKEIKDSAERFSKQLEETSLYLTLNNDVIAGQGTIAIELLEQNPHIDVIVASVGTGSMIAGIAVAAKKLKPSIKIIAAEPAMANDCFISKRTGVLTANSGYPETIAGALVGSVYDITWQIIRDKVDDVITVSEDEIRSATLLIWDRCKLVVEPSAGVAFAAVLSEKFLKVKGHDVAVVLCGGNVDLKTFFDDMLGSAGCA